MLLIPGFGSTPQSVVDADIARTGRRRQDQLDVGAVNLSQQRYHFACGVRHLIHQRTGSGLAGGGGFEHVINKFDLTL